MAVTLTIWEAKIRRIIFKRPGQIVHETPLSKNNQNNNKNGLEVWLKQ
jgi:threonine dehydratase